MSEPATTQPAPNPVLSPKENFLQLEEIAKGWRNVVRSSLTTTALTYALAEFATDNPSSEQLAGTQNFIKVLLNLAEPKSPPRSPFPDKRLSPISNEDTDRKKPEGKK
jgi:hypothetical protein